MERARALILVSPVLALASTTLAFDTRWHADATRLAMEQNGFSSDARLLCQFANYLTDYFSVASDEIDQLLPADVPGRRNSQGGRGG